jgi:hypothetical protein
LPAIYDHGADYSVESLLPSGQSGNASVAGNLPGREFVAKGDGGAFLAGFSPHGPSGPFQPPAYLRLDQSRAWPGWTVWSESHDQPVLSWYGDIALAPSGDGGAVFVWSQARDRFGLFARRFSATGQVTAVPSAPIPIELARVRFVAGQGVRVMVSLPADVPGRLELFDLGGRRKATQVLAGGTARKELMIPGTGRLSSGLYFVRLAARDGFQVARVVVAR